jgi:inner membrane protein
MPTALTHALAGAASGFVLVPPMPPSFYLLTAGLGLLPDTDVIAFPLGIPYGSRYGHRGISHSLTVAVAAGLLFGLGTAGAFGVTWWYLALAYFLVIALHSVLDAMTDGGMGIGFFAPFTDRRYFFPWRPIRVSPIGFAVFSRWGWRALLSEVLWVWLPLALLVGVTWLGRSR